MAIGSAVAWGAWAVVLFNINPDEAGLAGVLLFFITLAMALMGTLSLGFAAFRVRVLGRRDVVSREIHAAFRHAFLFTFVAIASLVLSANDLLHTWHLMALVAFAVAVEFGLSSIDGRPAHRHRSQMDT
ncbi:MAG: hypothetical protein RL141_746 [Candidatus Parcubacteria bacterium]